VPSLACVTQGTYDEVAGERDGLLEDKARLERRVQDLERSSESLGAERARLIDEMEDLRQAQEQLDRDVRRLRAAEAELSTALEDREKRLAATTEEVDRLRGTYEGLVADLEEEVASGQIEIEQLRGGLLVNLTQDVLFPSGSARLSGKGRKVLGKVADNLRGIPHEVRVQGHTDNVPIQTERFPSNWELASARASEVVKLLVTSGVDPSRLSAVSYGEFSPRASNDTPEGREKNRRIEITLQPIVESPASRAKDGESPGGT
jgi:chemotaxis protein MotB